MSEVKSPVLELQRQRMLLQMEYEQEKEAFRQAQEARGLEQLVSRGDAWLPLHVGRSYYNSLNQFCVEVFRQPAEEDEDPIDHNFEFGKPVQFFKTPLNPPEGITPLSPPEGGKTNPHPLSPSEGGKTNPRPLQKTFTPLGMPTGAFIPSVPPKG